MIGVYIKGKVIAAGMVTVKAPAMVSGVWQPSFSKDNGVRLLG